MVSPEVEGQSYTCRGEGASLSSYIVPKLCAKNIWLIARVKNSRHFPYTIHKNNKWKAGSLVQGKMFLFLEAAEKKGRESWQGKPTKQGWHLPCEPEQAEGNISLHLGEISVLCLSATKRQHVYPSERRLAQYQPNTIIWRNLDLSAEEREKPSRASNDGSCVQSYLRNTHKLHSLYHFKKKIESTCWKKSARVNRFTDINNMRSRPLCKYSFQLCLT